MNWYQWEISNICVSDGLISKGKSKIVLELAEERAINNGAKIIQTYFKSNNPFFFRLFTNNAYKEVNKFICPKSKNEYVVFQKKIKTIK